MSQLPPPTLPVIVELAPDLPPEQNPAAVYLASLRPTGRRSMLHHLNTIAALLSAGQHTAETLPWASLRYQHTAALAVALHEHYPSPATANTALKALRRVLLEAYKLGQLSAEDYNRARMVKGLKGETLPRGRALAGGELVALMAVCANDVTPAGARDAALLAVAYGAGLRRAELVKLTLADYAREGAALTVRSGKGGKDRLTYLATGPAAALEDWLQVRGSGQPSEWLFCPINKGSRILRERGLTDQAVFNIFRKRASTAGVQSFSPHDLRRTFISDLLEAGADIVTVQKLAGHAGVQTTARYDRRGEAVKKRAAGLLHLPYQRRQVEQG